MPKGRAFRTKVDDLGRECTVCKVYQLWSGYPKDQRAKTGYAGRCKICTSNYNKKYMERQEHKEAARLATEKYRNKKDPNRLRWIDIAVPTCVEVLGQHICKGSCGQVKPCSAFYEASDFSNGHESSCRDCRNEARKLRWNTNYNNCKDAEAFNRESWSVEFINRLIRDFNLTLEQYKYMLDQQNELCFLCSEQEPKTKKNGNPFRLSVDHDHRCCPESGKSCGVCIRGLLCSRCNFIVGRLEGKLILASDLVLQYVDRRPLNDLPIVE